MVLVTGFEPFTTGKGLRLTHNPTADVACAVAARSEGVRAGVLPVSYAQTPLALQALFEAHDPSVWIGMGYAPHREALDVEVVALNMAHATRGDNDGACPQMEPIIAGGPLAYETTLHVPTALSLLKAHGLDAQPAFHAGTFLCNQVFYLGAHRAASPDTSLKVAAFLHVAPMDDFGPLEVGVSALITSLCETLEHA